MAKSKSNKNLNVEDIIENINDSAMDQLMGEDYSIYAEDVIKNRALPDARDGLKPVQRRIIYSMYLNNNFFNKPTKKCAKIVGDVMGKYHPHGDAAIYDALVRLAQEWKMNYPLIDFQGNKGSIDGDEAAAPRYTEARLSKLAEELVTYLDKNVVETTLNFDDSELEPVILPSRFPNLFLNGSEGIAVAIATDIPPHNLKELIDATIYRINHKNCAVEDLLQFIKGPDFPTGGFIYESEQLKEIYKTGRGKIEVLSKWEISEEKDKKIITITEIPYKVLKKDLVYSIEKIAFSKEINGITDVIDATEMGNIKIIIELKKDANPELILNYLISKTDIKSNYNANMYAIVDGRPQLMSLDLYLDTYIKHQINVYTNNFKFDLSKDKKRLNIIQGLKKAISILDDLIKTIRSSQNRSDVINNLILKYDFNDEQAEAIANLQLYRLSNTDITKLIEEENTLNSEIELINSLLVDRKKLEKYIIGELKSISSKYSVERKTNIIQKQEEVSINLRDLIIEEETYVSFTRDGYIKRSSIKSFKSSNVLSPDIKIGDCLVCAALSNTKDYILAFTNKGNFMYIPVNEILESKWKQEGKHINYICNLPFEEKIIKCMSIQTFNENVFIISITKKGQIKRTRLSEFISTRNSKPINMMKIYNNDELADVCYSTGNDKIMIFGSNGIVSFYNENDIPIYGNKTSGVKGIKGLKDSIVVKLIKFNNDEKSKILLITDKGFTKIINSDEIEYNNRLGKLSHAFKIFKSDPHNLIYAEKIVNTSEKTIINMLDEENNVNEIIIDDYHLSRNEYAKVDSKRKFNYKMAYNYNLDRITNNIKTTIIKNIIGNEKDSDRTNQSLDESENINFSKVSIFEDFGD